MRNIELTSIMPLVTGLSAILALIAMQIVTAGSTFKNPHGRLHWCQRLSLAALSAALAYDTYDQLTTMSYPSLSDLLLHTTLFGVLACWAYRRYHIENLRHKVRSFTVFDNPNHTGKPTKVNHVVID
jgi:hypothetical protein